MIINDKNVLRINVFAQIILFFVLIFTYIFAHPHTNYDNNKHPHTHPKNETNFIDEVYEFNDQGIQSTNIHSKQYENKKKIILFDDNLYLLNDDFDFGDDEFELQELEINTDDLKIAKEYEDFLNSFFNESTIIGSKASSSKAYNKKNLNRLNDKINDLEFDKTLQNKKIENLEKQLKSAINDKNRVDDFRNERLLLNQKIENLEKQLKSAINDNNRSDAFSNERLLLNRKIENLEKQLKSAINDKSYADIKEEYSTLKELQEPQQELQKPKKKTAKPPIPSYSKFGISFMMGLTLPIYQNEGIGGNLGTRLSFPSFNIASMKIKLGTEIYLSSMLPKSNDSFMDYIYEGYYLTSIIGNLSISPFEKINNQHLSSIEIRPGFGGTLASIGNDIKFALSIIPIDITYYIPMNLSGYKIGLNLRSQMTMGHPTDDRATSFNNVNLLIQTPIQF